MQAKRRVMRAPLAANGAAVLLAALLSATAPAPVHAQAAEREVVAVVERLFEGMLARDTAMMRSTFDPSARLFALVTRDGQTTVNALPIDNFIASIGRMQGEGANERIYAPEVRIDGNLATVWTFYTLHVGERFIHCGIDALQLYRTPAGWKIVSIADTRRQENCEPPGREFPVPG
ncbi:MAG: nuclear transport factor 2 family protein [Gemmatimonadetes bacterium]|nr:nuclear transport factor 2 family protein [Gemmatimonadota bacterium]